MVSYSKMRLKMSEGLVKAGKSKTYIEKTTVFKNKILYFSI